MSEDPILLALPGVAAGLLSAYNWWQMNRGAVIKPGKPVNYALERDGEKDGVIKYYFPVLMHNTGKKAGMITEIMITFKSKSTEKIIDINRRVEMSQEEGDEEISSSITGIEPMFPFFVPADEGAVAIFECLDYDHDVIPIDQELTCKILIKYDNKKKSKIEFPFQLLREDISMLSRGTMKWLKPTAQDVQLPGTTDRDRLLSLLEELNLDDQFESVIDSEGTHFDRTVQFGGTKIIRLDLSEMKIPSLPESIGDFEILEYLDLGNNLLKSLPSSIGNLRNLIKLNLSSNKMLEALPDSIGHLINLKKLDISRCNLSFLSEEIGNLSSLESLRARDNQLTSLPESLGNLSNLRRLNIANNQLESLPESIGSLQKLRKLIVDKNNLKSIPNGILKIKKFTELIFKENEITTLPANLVEDGGHITSLFFEDNQIQYLPERLEKLDRLTYLGIRKNPIATQTESVQTSLKALKDRGCKIYLD
ncbi:MAG: leucine-rich repeat domain-containing protein [Candidatus Hodarchaeales archaeon]